MEAVTRELGRALGATSVSFLIVDLSGRALVRLAHVAFGERTPDGGGHRLDEQLQAVGSGAGVVEVADGGTHVGTLSHAGARAARASGVRPRPVRSRLRLRLAAMLASLYPVVTALAACGMTSARLRGAQAAGACLAMAGTLLLATG